MGLSCVWSYEFDAAHRLLGHAGKCWHPHGHRYRVDVEVGGDLDELGMIVDFGALKSSIGSWIDDNWDHAFVVGEMDMGVREAMGDFERVFVMPGNPTAENMACFLAMQFSSILPERVELLSVVVWETPTCRAKYTV